MDPDLDYTELAKITEGFSGSDLKELCRNAAMLSVREAIKQRIRGDSMGIREIKGEEVGIQQNISNYFRNYMRIINLPLLKTLDVRPMMMEDFIDAIHNIQDHSTVNRSMFKESAINLDYNE